MLFAFLAVSVPAYATTAPKTVDVSWTRQLSAIQGGFADSSSARALGAAAPTAHDTSSAIDIRDFVLPDKGTGQLPTASDSISWLRIDLFNSTTTPAIVVDTLFLTIQVSNDGVASWVSCTPTSLFLTTTDSALGAAILEQESSNACFYVLRQRVGAVASGDLFFPIRSSATAITWQQIYGWPYMRLIVQSSDRTGRLDAKVTGFIPN